MSDGTASSLICIFTHSPPRVKLVTIQCLFQTDYTPPLCLSPSRVLCPDIAHLADAALGASLTPHYGGSLFLRCALKLSSPFSCWVGRVGGEENMVEIYCL